jgi:hypothetical protein
MCVSVYAMHESRACTSGSWQWVITCASCWQQLFTAYHQELKSIWGAPHACLHTTIMAADVCLCAAKGYEGDQVWQLVLAPSTVFISILGSLYKCLHNPV